jgi:hypothetical protein
MATLTQHEQDRYHVPRGGTWYHEQALMLEAYAASADGLTITWDKPTGSKIFGLYTGMDHAALMALILDVPLHDRCGYELIPHSASCKAYLDIEWVGPADPLHTRLIAILASVRTRIKNTYGIAADIHICCGSRSKDCLIKHSYHAAIDNLVFHNNHDGAMRWLLASPDAEYTPDPAIDTRVYSRNRQFRLPHCCKIGAKVPLLRISGDPAGAAADDFAFEYGDAIEPVLPFFLSNPPRPPQTVFVGPHPHAAPAASQRKRHCPVATPSKQDLPFRLPVLQALIETAGDTVTVLTGETYLENSLWRIQGDQRRQTRTCLATPGATHDSNNCLLFVEKFDGRFRIKYHCTATHCSQHDKTILGYVFFDPAACEWKSTLSPQLSAESPAQGPEASSLDSDASSRDASSLDGDSDAMVCENDHTDPHSNTYELVKARHELTCFKVCSPFQFAKLLPDDSTDSDSLSDRGLEDMEAIRPHSLKMYFSNLYYYAPIKHRDGSAAWEKRLFITAWLGDETMRQVTKIVVDPACTRSDVYNLWRGFAAAALPPVDDAAVPHLVQPIINHIHRVVAADNHAHTDWNLDWMANLVQRPHQKTGVGILLYGKEGCGKGIIPVFLRKLVLGSQCSFQTSKPEHDLFGQFAKGPLSSVFVQIDEASSAYEQREKMKDLITNDKFNYEKKGRDTITVRNLVNLLLTTNNENALSISPTDRRFALFRCTNLYKGDRAYFDTLGAHLDRPEVARAFYQFLMARDLSPYHHDFQHSRPITEYYKEAQLASIPVVSRFFSAIVNDNTCDDARASDLFERFKAFHTAGNYKYPVTATSFGRDAKRIPGVTKRRCTAGWVYSFNRDDIRRHLQEQNELDPDASTL